METISEEPEHHVLLDFESTSPSHLEDITLDFDPSDNTSPFSDTFTNGIQRNTSMCGRTVKEYEEQLRLLKKENFNLKLRIYFLEERMTRLGRVGPSGDADEDAERKLIELKIELEGLKREMKNKQLLLAQAGKAIELMEEQHNSEIQKLKREMRELQEARSKPQHRQYESLDNSMQLYADAFNVRQSLLMPPPPPPGPSEIKASGDSDSQLLAADLQLQLQQCQQELEASRERERQLSEALESKEPEIQIKVQELCQKDCLLEEQRKIIVEIQIRLDEKQKMLETLRQSLEASQATAARLEAEQASLHQQMQESEEKRSKSCKVVQSLMTKTKQLTSELREAKERRSKAEWEARQQPPDEIGEMTIEETERLWAELEQQRRQVERLTRENSSLLREKAAVEQDLRQEISDLKLQLDRAMRPNSLCPASGAELGSTAKMMLDRLDELAAFLAALLRRPHLLASLSAAQRTSLLKAMEQSWDKTRKRYSLSLSLTWQHDITAAGDAGGDLSVMSVPADEESLIGHIRDFLQGPESEELMSEVEAQRERSAELWPVSVTSALGAGNQLELATGEISRIHDNEDEDEEGGGATAVEREAPGSHNQSESEAWSEPDRSVSLARIGLPESCTTPAPTDRTALVSPASSEADLVTRTPGKRASMRRLANRLRDSEQINEALRAELGAYKSLYKSHGSPVTPQSPQQQIAVLGLPSMLQEMESQRSRLESLLKQNDVIRQQLEASKITTAVKGDEALRLREAQIVTQQSQLRISQLESELSGAQERCKVLESQLANVQQELSAQTAASNAAEQTVATLLASEANLKQQLAEAQASCVRLEQQAEAASVRATHLETLAERASEQLKQLECAAARDSERCEHLAQQVQESEAHCKLLQEEIAHQQEIIANKPECLEISVQTSEKNLALDHSNYINSTGPSSLIHLSDCDDVFHTDNSLAGATAGAAVDENQRHTLSSPDLGIESDTGRLSSLEAPNSPGLAEPSQNKLQDENWRLKQRLAQSQQLMEACLSALCRKNKARQQVQASMEQQLRRTEEVLVLAKQNLRSLAPSSSPPLAITPPSKTQNP